MKNESERRAETEVETYEPGSTFQFEDRKGPFWKQHDYPKTAIAADGHEYCYGQITGPQGAKHFGYALHSGGCRCVLRRLALELEAMRHA